jgi:hypothetical protein
MTILFGYAESVLTGLVKLDQSDLPLGLVSRVRRVLRNFREEMAIYNPEREKILKELCVLDDQGDGKQFWKFPQPEDAKYPEFEKRWNELQTQKVIFPYEPIKYLDMIDNAPDEVKKKIVAKGSDFDVLDGLNSAYKEQFSKPTDTSAGDSTNKAPIGATPDA